MRPRTGGLGGKWGHARVYNNRSSYSQELGQGLNWLVDEQPYLTKDGDTIVMVKEQCEHVWFDPAAGYYSGSDYTARYGVHDELEHDQTNNIFKVTMYDGSLLTFHDFDQTDDPPGLLESHETPGGQTTTVDSYTNGRIQEIRRSHTAGGSTTTESYYYQFNSDDRMQYVTLRRRIDAGSWDDIRRVEYTYYGSSESYGSDGDLKTVKQQLPDGQGGWTTVDTQYYRYHKDGDADGCAHGLKYVLEAESYKRLDDAVADPLMATDAQVADYADLFVKYDRHRRASEVQSGAGSHTSTFAYTYSGNTDDENNWHSNAVETRPDNSKITAYTNFLGQVLVRELKDGNDRWIEYDKYNSDYSVLLHAQPSAVTSYDDSQANLGVSLKANDGMIHITDYYTTDGNGAAKGHCEYKKITRKQGVRTH